MPIFHFDIADGVRLEDPVGLDCSNEHDARKTADMIARQIAIDVVSSREDRAVVVVDESGHEVYKAPIKDWGSLVRSPPFRSISENLPWT